MGWLRLVLILRLVWMRVRGESFSVNPTVHASFHTGLFRMVVAYHH